MLEQPPIVVKDIYLRPGEISFGKYNYRFRTLLGSCVAIVLWHPTLKIGGMSHTILPYKKVNQSIDSNLLGKYADQAIDYFESEAKKFKTLLSDYQAKLFGGANLLDSVSSQEFNIGEQNIHYIKLILQKKNIPIIAEDLGGNNHRKIYFTVWDGEVWLEN